MSSEGASSEYYGVFVPMEYRSEEESDVKFVFHVKDEALGYAKLFKKARFKAFSSYLDAVMFAQNGLDSTKNQTNSDGDAKADAAGVIGEKPSPFRAPKSQELVKFRKAIETGDIDKVYATIWDNPRYLVSSGDTPSILQEGSRYNALHVGAKSKNHEICDLVLSTISDEAFIKLLYGDNSNEQVLTKDRMKVLTDLYLNTPDKGLNETPLHFAVKFGAVEVVRVLLSYPQCDKTLRNKYGKSPDMIICDRCDDSNVSAKKRQISLLLEGSYYVPVLRAEDNTMIPIIGEPFSPGRGPILRDDPMSPRLEIRAYAGPLNRREAEQFRRVWKTPPRKTGSSAANKSTSREQTVATMRYRDAEKGLERLGNTLASKFQVEWKEYWPFLDSFVDIASDEGLHLFEEHLSARMNGRSDSSREMSELANLLESCTLRDAKSPRLDWNTDDVYHASGPSAAADHLDENSKDTVDPLLCIEKACQVYATHLSNSILQIFGKPPGDITHLLRKEIVHVHSLIKSYLDDARFTTVDFRIVHSRLGKMTGQKIRETSSADEVACIKDKLVALKTEFSNDSSLDGSQDTEMVGSGENQSNCTIVSVINCLLDKILNGLSPSRDPSWWACKGKSETAPADLDECSCDLRLYCSTESQLFGRSNSFKRKPVPLFLDVGAHKDSDRSTRYGLDDVDKAAEEANVGNSSENVEQMEAMGDCCDDDGDSSDEFFTPPSTPEPVRDELDDEPQEFEDAKTLREEIFIEGEEPLKVDCEVYEALLFSDCIPSAKDFPCVYKWYHAVSLYSDVERHSWQNNNVKKKACEPDTSFAYDPAEPNSPSSPLPRIANSPVFSKPQFNSLLLQECQSPQHHQNFSSPKIRRPQQSWFKVTGLNSPKASLKRRLT